MSLETQTHRNFLFNVSTDQYADIAANAKKKAAKANGVDADSLRTKTVLQKETVLSTIFGVGAKTIEIDGTDDLDKIDKQDWKGATAVTQFKTKKGQAAGTVSSGSDDARAATISIAGKSKPKPSFSPAREFDKASLNSMLTALSANAANESTFDLSSTTAMDTTVPSVFTAKEPIGIFGTPANDAPSFTSFVEAVSSSLDNTEKGFDDGGFLSEMKAAMPGFFQLVAANDDDGADFGGRGLAGFGHEAVTFAHEGMGVRRDVIDMRQSEAQERFMSVMKAISDYEGESGHNEGSSFSIDLNAA